VQAPPEPAAPAPPAIVAEAAAVAEPSARERKRTRWIEAQRAVHDKLWPILSSQFPKAFCLPAVPLAIGVHRQILEVAGDDIDPGELSRFLRYWTARGGYRVAIQRGDLRRNIDGSEAGAPTVDQRNHAGRQLWGARHRPISAADGEPGGTIETMPRAAVAGAASPEPPAAAPAAAPLASMVAPAGRA
jgi:sRNA-binding protein